ncbi:armadillo-type protein [Rhodofomes roseus]|uniref:Armadillo-type protein n=1 Tax=Rhodofomes roseus TaxID=34475 RepID=A0ABQ8K4D7_9APHY|nr:armadillo-type protein [Rhodofomes roseus]KAH9831544.1 armadillo-type protein [Rhodofomes roseus]
MFKSILPSRRVPATDFQMVTPPFDSVPNGKENYPELSASDELKPSRVEKSKKRKGKEQAQGSDSYATTHAFEKLLDELQVPDNMREKLATMDAGVKAAFVKSSKDLAIMSSKSAEPPMTPRGVRKARSIESISSPQPTQNASQSKYNLSKVPDRPRFMNTNTHNRGVSFDANRQTMVFHEKPAPAPKPAKEKRSKNAMAPAKLQKLLSKAQATHLDIEVAKKLRLHLRNEPASWTQEFIQEGGYTTMLTRLHEILTVEWREEQHDDQLLHELLRCFKALMTSAVGCAALRSCCPAPYTQIVTVLYSDKRPGDVATRHLMIELLLSLYELYPSSSLPSTGNPSRGSPTSPYGHNRTRSVPWESEASATLSTGLIVLPPPHSSVCSLVKSLLLTPAPRPAEDDSVPVQPHFFIEKIHRPRVYKAYLEEMSNLCRDFFWIYCHPANKIWNLDETDEEKAERPRAPSGMSGGVEYEAMCYMSTHLKFLNAYCRAAEELHYPPQHPLSAYQFHRDLFASGMDRIIMMARRASTAYYPILHLEIARYIRWATRSGIEIPWGISRLMGEPPVLYLLMKPRPAAEAKEPSVAPSPGKTNKGSSSVPSSPTKAGNHYTTERSHAAPPGQGLRRITPMFGF